jgi:AraC-like DNA-binding protein
MAVGPVAEAWHHGMESTFGGLQVVPLPTSIGPATGSFASTDLGSVEIFGISGTPQQLVRPVRSRRGSPTESIKVCAVRRGQCVIEQSGRAVMVKPGEFGLYDTGRPYRLIWQGSWECDVMTASRTAMGVSTQAIDRAQSRTWSTTHGAGALLIQFMTTSVSLAAPTPAARDHLATAGASLLAGVIVDDLEPVADNAEGVFRQQVESYIDHHLHQENLSLASIAAAHHVSVRTIQRLFAGTGKGLSGLIRQRRLDAVRRGLANPHLANLTIADVAARWCIHDAQWLARAFKAQFDMTPSEFRRSAVPASPLYTE